MRHDAAAVAGAEIWLSEVRFSGNRAISTELLERLAAPLAGRFVRLDEIEALRHEVTQLYVRRGFVNSGALYADPPVDNGVLRLTIVEGRVTGHQLRGNGRLYPGYVTGRLLERDEVLNLAVLEERYRRLLADPLIDRLDVLIRPGAVPGEATVEIDMRPARSWSLVAFANNYRSASTGEAIAGLNGVLRNLTGLGDAFDATLQLSRGGGRASLDWRVPLGTTGGYLSFRHDDGDARIVEAPLDDADVESRVRAVEIEFGQLLVDRLDRRFTLALAHAERRNTTTVFGQPFSFSAGIDDGFSRVRAWRFSQELMLRGSRSVFALRSSFSVGRSNALEGEDEMPGFPARDFAYWSGQVRYVLWPAGSRWRVEARASAQKAKDHLMALEQFALGGNATVRGYRENSLVRDNGHAASLEWHGPPLDPVPWLDYFLFYDGGAAWNRDERKAWLRSAGIGLGCSHRGLRLDLAWAHNLDPRARVGERGLQDRGIHVAMSYAF